MRLSFLLEKPVASQCFENAIGRYANPIILHCFVISSHVRPLLTKIIVTYFDHGSCTSRYLVQLPNYNMFIDCKRNIKRECSPFTFACFSFSLPVRTNPNLLVIPNQHHLSLDAPKTRFSFEIQLSSSQGLRGVLARQAPHRIGRIFVGDFFNLGPTKKLCGPW